MSMPAMPYESLGDARADKDVYGGDLRTGAGE